MIDLLCGTRPTVRGSRSSNRKKTLQSIRLICSALCLSGFLAVGTASAVDLSGTVFETAGKKYHIDPALLYSISLVESAVRADKKGGKEALITPSPWTLRTRRKPYYAKSKEEAEALLAQLLKVNKSVDIGLMQINSRWHKSRVKRVADLLDPLTNVSVAAEILSDLFKKYPDDAFAAIGRYHSGTPDRAAWYASHVVRVYENISQEN